MSFKKRHSYKVTCDHCGKGSKWIHSNTEDGGTIDVPGNNWILGYVIQGAHPLFKGQDSRKDFCSLNCLLKAVEEHFKIKKEKL